jgi:SAM-dependent methyltransferase
MAEISGKHLRSTFDEAAELYDRARPGYPPEPFNDLSDVADLRPGARILEFGPGTGQTTVPLAERKFQITAVELGPNLAAVARRMLARFPNVAVTVAAFEDFPLPSEPFDAVVSATAFHWLDPEVRVTKAADALWVGGVLARIAMHHIDGGDAQCSVDVQDCYRRWLPKSVGKACRWRRTFRRIAPNSNNRACSNRPSSADTNASSPLMIERCGGRIRKPLPQRVGDRSPSGDRVCWTLAGGRLVPVLELVEPAVDAFAG